LLTDDSSSALLVVIHISGCVSKPVCGVNQYFPV
jgi:hypothetical protein